MKRFDLEQHPRIGTGFKTPDNFFEGFEDQLFDKLPQRESRVIPIFSKYRSLYYAAAAVLVTAIAIPIANRLQGPAELDDTAIEHYLAYDSGINQFDILTVLEPQDIEQLKTDIPVADEAIEDYLTTSDIETMIID